MSTRATALTVIVSAALAACSSPANSPIANHTADEVVRGASSLAASTSLPVLWSVNGQYLGGFLSTDNGNTPPEFLVEGSNPGIQSFETATDGNGSVYIWGTCYCNGARDWQVSRFRPDANGNVKPDDIIDCSIPSPDEFGYFAVGRDGRTAVNILGTNGVEVDVVPAGTSGCSKGVTVISGPDTQLGLGVAMGPFGSIYVLASPPNEVLAFSKGASGDAMPSRTILGPHTKLNGPIAIAADSAGRLYAANYNDNSITVYRASAHGDASPIQRIWGSNTQIYYPVAIAVSSDGRIFVANYDTDAINVYAAGATGNTSPIQTIAGSATGLRVQGNEYQISVAPK